MHPTFPAGHATTAIAACTLLKIVFDEDALFTDIVAPDPLDLAELASVTHVGQTVGGEINKLAANICDFRTAAGVHFLDDNRAISVGEEIAEVIFLDMIRRTGVCDRVSCSYRNMAGDVRVLSNDIDQRANRMSPAS